MDKRFMEISIRSDPALTERLSAILSQIGIEGFWEEEDTLRCYIGMSRWSREMEGEIRSIAGMIARASSSSAPVISFEEAPERNWNEAWERTIAPIRISDRMVVAPSWQIAEAPPADVVLVIDPKMSFGTGHHETTRLSLRLVEHFVRPGMTVMDAGTGTGILAIAAVKLGAASAVAFDVDEWSFRNAEENIARNGVGEKVRLFHGGLSATPPGTFDLVVANIQLDVIGTLLKELIDRTNAQGILLFSGILTGEDGSFRSLVASHDLRIQSVLTDGEWLAAAAVKG